MLADETNRETLIHPHAALGRAMVLGRLINLADLPDIDRDSSTESEGEGGNTNNDLSEVDEFDINEVVDGEAWLVDISILVFLLLKSHFLHSNNFLTIER